MLYPQFLGGERRCPLGRGGFPGYYEFLSNIASKERKQRQAALNWFGGPYHPDEIDDRRSSLHSSRFQQRSPYTVIFTSRILEGWRMFNGLFEPRTGCPQ